MNPYIWIAIAVVVITETVVMGAVLKRLKPLLALIRIPDANRRRALQTATETLVTDHLRAEISGDPAQLGAALGMLLPQVSDLWRAQGVDLDPDAFKTVVETIAVKHGIASRKQLEAALKIAA